MAESEIEFSVREGIAYANLNAMEFIPPSQEQTIQYLESEVLRLREENFELREQVRNLTGEK